MKEKTQNIDPREFADVFERLQKAAFKEIRINGTGVRVLGINLMHTGSGWLVAKHRHSFFEFHYIAEGYTYTTIGDREQRVEAGCFYLMPPGTGHAHREEPGCGHVGMSLRFEFLPENGQGLGRPDELLRVKKICEEAHSRPVPVGEDWQQELWDFFCRRGGAAVLYSCSCSWFV